jgi:hypothetical protein
MIDLHMHTTSSDGELSPEEIVDLAIKCNLQAIAITDHDVIDAVENAINYAKDKNIEVISGIEVRANEPEAGFLNIDIIGLFVDHKNEELIEFTEKIKTERMNQKREMINKLRKFGFDISFEEVAKEVKGAWGRPHLAKVLLRKYPQEFTVIRDVFDRYLGTNKPAYVERENKTRIKEAISIIHKAGGVAILAHPGIYEKEDSLRLIKMFIEAGGEGIETYYPYYNLDSKINKEENEEMIEFYRRIVNENNLLESGGNDFHDSERGMLGEVKISMEVLTKIRAIKSKN